MEGFEKFDLKDLEDIKYLIPSGFLEKVNSAEDLRNVDPFDAMIRVIGAEAANQKTEGQKGVAHVIRNRYNHPNVGLFDGYSINSVILRPGAFETVDFAKLPDPSLNAEQSEVKRKILAPRENFKPWELKQVIESAGAVYIEGEKDNTGGATYFHPINYKSPYDRVWERTNTIGKHNFYKDK